MRTTKFSTRKLKLLTLSEFSSELKSPERKAVAETTNLSLTNFEKFFVCSKLSFSKRRKFSPKKFKTFFLKLKTFIIIFIKSLKKNESFSKQLEELLQNLVVAEVVVASVNSFEFSYLDQWYIVQTTRGVTVMSSCLLFIMATTVSVQRNTSLRNL